MNPTNDTVHATTGPPATIGAVAWLAAGGLFSIAAALLPTGDYWFGTVVLLVLAWIFAGKVPLRIVGTLLLVTVGTGLLLFVALPWIARAGAFGVDGDGPGHPLAVVRMASSATFLLVTLAAARYEDVVILAGKLPGPRLTRLLLVQILLQAHLLGRDARSLHRSYTLRTAGYRMGSSMMAPLSLGWMARLVSRADRIGNAMAIRGYLEAPRIGELPPVPITGRYLIVSAVAFLGAVMAARLGVI